jgi:peptidase E
MAIYLTGGGEQQTFKILDNLFMSELPNGSVIGLFAQATDDQEDALERIEGTFDSKDISKIELITNPNSDLSQYHALIIEGGNTFKLISEIRDSNFFNSIINFYKTGKPIYADSAGAIILGSDVHTAFLGDDGDEDQLSLQDYRGLDILSPWCIHAHATPDDFEQVQEILYNIGSPVLAISEETGVYISENQLQVFGDTDLWVFNFEGRFSVKPGETFSF